MNSQQDDSDVLVAHPPVPLALWLAAGPAFSVPVLAVEQVERTTESVVGEYEAHQVTHACKCTIYSYVHL